MKNKFLLCLAATMAITGCGSKGRKIVTEPVTDLPNGDGQTLRLSVMHNQNFRMKYVEADKVSTNGNAILPYVSPDGVNYKVGDFKPVWKEIQNKLKFTINDVTPTDAALDSAKKAYDNKWKLDGFKGVDILNGNALDFTSMGVTDGQFVPLNMYYKFLPNFKAFLDSNDVVKKTITAGDGNIYYSPYFDGYNSIERMSIMRADWVQKLLDGASFTANTTDQAAAAPTFAYKATMPATLDETINVVKEDGTEKTTVNKKYAKNITAIFDELAQKNAQTMTDALRNYIDSTYGTFYGNARSNLFVGQSAAYDADELVALLRVVKANSVLLTGQSEIVVKPFYPREDSTDRTSDILRWAGSTWGVRGLESRKDYLFIDAEGNVRDARMEDKTFAVIESLNQLYKENLITNEFKNEKINAPTAGRYGYRAEYAQKANLGFMTYDYNQTTTAFNVSAAAKEQTDYNLTPVLPAVADWFDNGEYFQFSESIRSVKTDAWAINADLSGKKLAKALELFDYMYSVEGNKLMSFGPDAWLDGTMAYKGQQIPKFKASVVTMFNASKKEGEYNTDGTMKTAAGGAAGNYTNFLRGWLGGTFPIGYIKNQGVEYQLTHANGQAGEAKIERAIELGTMKVIKPSLDATDSPFYTVVPTTFPFTNGEETFLSSLNTFTNNFQQTSSSYENLLLRYVVSGYGNTAPTDADGLLGKGLSKENLKTYISVTLKGNGYLQTQKSAYFRMQ